MWTSHNLFILSSANGLLCCFYFGAIMDRIALVAMNILAQVCFFFFLIYLFYLFLAVLDLRCCVWAFSSCGERGLLFVVVGGLLTAVTSFAAEHGL